MTFRASWSLRCHWPSWGSGLWASRESECVFLGDRLAGLHWNVRREFSKMERST